jgi:hypothetical protein
VLAATAEWIAGRRYSLDRIRIDYLVGDWLHVPVLVFQGAADDSVSAATSDRSAAGHPALVGEVRVRGALRASRRGTSIRPPTGPRIGVPRVRHRRGGHVSCAAG